MSRSTYPLDVLTSIVEFEGAFADDEEKGNCQSLVQKLTEEEKELAAQSSYAYWLWSSSRQKNTNKEPDNNNVDAEHENVRLRMAMREFRRHLLAENGNYQKAFGRFRGSCAYRKDCHLDIVRTLFDCTNDDSDVSNFTKQETSLTSDEFAMLSPNQVRDLYRNYISQELKTQTMVVRGKDKSNRAIVIKMPRESCDMNVEAYVIAHVYLAERALAATEFLSRGAEDKVAAVLDFGSYSSRNSPTVVAIRRLITVLQLNYPERLKYLVVLDPPLWMRGIINIIYPFLATQTQEKIRLVSEEAQRRNILSELIDTEQAMPFMLPGGKLKVPIDCNHFLRQVPFHCLYDEE